MKRRLFLAGIFSTPIAAVASSPNLNSILGEDKEITLSIDYDYTGYSKLIYSQIQYDIVNIMIEEFKEQAGAKGFMITNLKHNNSVIGSKIRKHIKENFTKTRPVDLLGSSLYVPNENSKGTFSITLNPELKRANVKKVS